MAYNENIHITYVYQPDIEPETLAAIQRNAVEQHAGLEKGADKQAEILLKTEEIGNLLYGSSDYTLIVAYAGLDPQHDTQNAVPVGYVLSSPHAVHDHIEMIDDLYAQKHVKLNGRKYDTKAFRIGKTLEEELEENLPDIVTEIHALPLEGSEHFYASQGFRGKNNSIFVKKLDA